MLINDLVSLLGEIPPVLATQWAVWFAVGLILSIWTRREKARLVFEPATPRHKSGARPPSGVHRAPMARPPAIAKSTDAFGELELLLEPQAATHRRPGESPSGLAGEPPRAPLGAPAALP